MITLKCLYSETNLFDRVDFQPGINIVLGKYASSERSVNGIGKSTLVRLLDFAFLSSPNKGSLNIKKAPFLLEHSVSLEFIVDSEVFKITRNFRNDAEIYFGNKDSNLVDYSLTELKTILGNKLFLRGTYPNQSYTNEWYRDFLRFFVKDDINRHKQNDPINFLEHQERKARLIAYNFYLLGLPNIHVQEFDELRVQINNERKSRKQLENQLEEETNRPISELRTELAQVTSRISKLEKSLREFEFLETYQDVQKSLEIVTASISEKLQSYNSHRRTLERYQDSYSIDIEVNLAEVRNLYESLDRELGTFVQTSLENVIEFRKQIAENRRKFLTEKENELNSAIDDLLKEITSLEGERQKLYVLLQEEGAFDSIRHTYEQLIEEKVTLERNSVKLAQLQDIEASIGEKTTRVSELVGNIIRDIRDSNEQIDNLRLLYKEILENAIFVESSTEGGFLDIQESSNQSSPANIIVDVPKSDSLGKYRFSMLAYSLTIFLNIIRSSRELPHFLAQDGVFHSIDRRTVVYVLNYVYRQTLHNPNFQYIITGNEDELYIPRLEQNLYGSYEFDFEKSIIAVYESVPEKMIFRREF